jgi:DNA-binding transcriptional MerR regulator
MPRRSYNMCGLGPLMNMYSQASSAIENEAQELKMQIEEIKIALKAEQDRKSKKQLREMKKHLKEKYAQSQQKMKELLQNVSDISSKAAKSLHTKKSQSGGCGGGECALTL